MPVTDMQLAALLCSRVCHDLMSPVGAIANGLEVLNDDDDEIMREHAMTLIQSSAQQASAKLQFARLAFGAAGTAAAFELLSKRVGPQLSGTVKRSPD